MPDPARFSLRTDRRDATPPPSSRPARQRNPRGQGGRLRDEIISAAAVLLEASGTEEAITMRAVARQVGVAAPSMIRHFSDPAEIIDAVVAEELSGLHAALAAAFASRTDPVDQLLAGARAYVERGRAHPGRYRVLFGRRFLDLWEREGRTMAASAPLAADTFGMIVTHVQACIDSGQSSSTDAFADAVATWLALHGLVTLPHAITSFPWPNRDDLLLACVTRLIRLTEPSHPHGR